jgi:hypothetical protein
VAAPVPEEAGHAEARPGRDEGAVSFKPFAALVQRVELRRPETADAVCGRFEVVDQLDAREAEHFL